MANLKSVVKDTAIYGLSSIVGRFLNYLLVPLYTAKLSAASGGYGVITNVYAYTALLMVILTYGMETTFFRYVNKEGENPDKVYSTTMISVASTSLLFVLLVLLFLQPISSFMGYADHSSYIWVMAVTVAVDAFACIPFAYLRYKKRPMKFAILKLANIMMAILLNLFFFLLLPAWTGDGGLVDAGYAFYINLFCSVALLFFLLKEITAVPFDFDKALLRRMLSYSWPILVLGVAGILNQTADKILFPYIYQGTDAHSQLGIYGAASKIAMIMAMITQAFRYAYEPFVFGNNNDKDSRNTYAKAMKFFIIFTLLAFLVVMAYIDLLKYIIGRDYWEGLKVVPVVMAAEIMMGIYFNLSFWYKLIDKTIWGAWFSGIGCVVLITVNVLFVPRYGYMACAWAGFMGYASAMTISYLVGQKKYPINYPLKEIVLYVALAAVLYIGIGYSNRLLPLWAALAMNTVIVFLFIAYIVKKDFNKNMNISLINKKHK
ncbi:MAG: lipopolysaccharide biosynthesis protein [Prevotella sp.]|nr:lipopolysaccharide biosynthesis protein [Bacteroidales bacterium]MDY2693056.1 lipopolysaccharide biosynthesis protein [Prevotella sp.]MDY6027669.1 lipopolysaccharide biosynthesis protein [Prevotella sp.]